MMEYGKSVDIDILRGEIFVFDVSWFVCLILVWHLVASRELMNGVQL